MPKNHLSDCLLPELERMGARTNDSGEWDSYEYQIATPLGPLFISPENRSGRGRRALSSHIHCRFDRADAAREWTGNQPGGKWNHYASEPSPDGCRALARHFLDLLSRVLTDCELAA